MDTGEEYPHPKYIRERARDNNSMIEKDQGDEDRYDSVKQHPAAAQHTGPGEICERFNDPDGKHQKSNDPGQGQQRRRRIAYGVDAGQEHQQPCDNEHPFCKSAH